MAGRGAKRSSIEELQKTCPILGEDKFNPKLDEMDAIQGRGNRQKFTAHIQQRITYFKDRYEKAADTAQVFQSDTPQPEHPEAVEIKKILDTIVLLAKACEVHGPEEWALKRLGEYEEWTKNGRWNNLGDMVKNKQMYAQWEELDRGEHTLQAGSQYEPEAWFDRED